MLNHFRGDSRHVRHLLGKSIDISPEEGDELAFLFLERDPKLVFLDGSLGLISTSLEFGSASSTFFSDFIPSCVVSNGGGPGIVGAGVFSLIFTPRVTTPTGLDIYVMVHVAMSLPRCPARTSESMSHWMASHSSERMEITPCCPNSFIRAYVERMTAMNFNRNGHPKMQL